MRRLEELTRRLLSRYPHLRRWEQTDDILQTVLLRLQRSLQEVRPESALQFFGLASTQIRRTLIDLCRHHFGPRGAAAHHHSDILLQSDDRTGILGSAVGDSSEPQTLDDWSRFHEAVDQLAEQDRVVFSLLWYSGLTQVDIASLLQVSERTVARSVTRARLRLSKSLEDQPD